ARGRVRGRAHGRECAARAAVGEPAVGGTQPGRGGRAASAGGRAVRLSLVPGRRARLSTPPQRDRWCGGAGVRARTAVAGSEDAAARAPGPPTRRSDEVAPII